MRTYVRLGVLVALAGLVLVGRGEANASPGTTVRVSVDSAGAQGTGDSGAWGRPAISADGRYIAFESFASNLVAGDTNNASDIFVRDRDADGDGIFDEAGAVATTRVSVNSGGGQASGFSFQPAISSDGRYVAFDSDAPDLVSGDSNNASDVFVHDRQTGATTRVSVSSAGAQANASSYSPTISNDGRYVAFYSEATNLVTGDGNGTDDVFVRDRQTGVTTRVSVSSGGLQGNGASLAPAISGDGRYVAFYSEATNLVSGDTNGAGDIFVRDRQAGTTARVSLDSAGVQGNGGSYAPAISGDGRLVAFYSAATNLVSGDTNSSWDVFVRDRQAGTTTRVSVDSAGNQGNGASSAPDISADGRYIAFQSGASNLVLSDTNGAEDIFVHNWQMGATTRVSVDSGGGQGNGNSSAPWINADGRFVAFYSRASNLVSGDTNGRQDVFVHERPAVVGGIAELPEAAGQSGGPRSDYALLAGLAAAALALLTAGVWHAGRRRLG